MGVLYLSQTHPREREREKGKTERGGERPLTIMSRFRPTACTVYCMHVGTLHVHVCFLMSLISLLLVYMYMIALCVLFVWVAFVLLCKFVCYTYTCAYISMCIVPILSPGAHGRC